MKKYGILVNSTKQISPDEHMVDNDFFIVDENSTMKEIFIKIKEYEKQVFSINRIEIKDME